MEVSFVFISNVSYSILEMSIVFREICEIIYSLVLNEKSVYGTVYIENDTS